LSEPRERIHDQQDVLALVAKVLRNRRRAPRAVEPHQRRIVRRRRDNNRPLQTLRPKNALDELLHFAATLADQPDDDDVGARVARHHPQQHALADAAAREQADTLAATDSQQRIDGPHADVERLLDRLA
jgi:hypothetical protein